MENFPLAFFLSYCDCAQEWGRKVLLELIKKSGKPGVNNSTQYLSGLDSKLKEPVPLMEYDGQRIKTTVIIKYSVGPDRTISGGRTLKEVFEEVAQGFESTWYLRNQKEKDFWIQGDDVDDIPLGNIHPAPRPVQSRSTWPNSG